MRIQPARQCSAGTERRVETQLLSCLVLAVTRPLGGQSNQMFIPNNGYELHGAHAARDVVD